MQGKKSFILYCDLMEIVHELSDEEAGKLVKHIVDYVNDKEPKIENRIISLAFIPIKNALKSDLKKWEKTREKRTESGKLGGLAKAKKTKQNLANVANAKSAKQVIANHSKSKQNLANLAVSVSVNDNVNVNDILLSKQEEIFQNIKNDKIWIEGVKEMNSCDSNEVYGHITTFKLHCKTNGHLKESEADAKKHFLNWIKKGNPIPSCRQKEYILPKRTENRNPI